MIKVYFLGSGDIAVPVLERLHQADTIELVGIGTQEDRPAGRKQKLMPTPVGKWCEENNLQVDKIKSVNTDDYLSYLNSLNPDFIFVASFGQLLKQPILDLPQISCVNLHASLLPLHRGASPIAACLLNGDEKTGVAFMKMDKGLDTGPVYCMFDYLIPETQKADALEMVLGKLGAENVEHVLNEIFIGNLQPVDQDHDNASYAGKISKKDGKLSWDEAADLIFRKVKAFYPWPGMTFMLELPNRKCHIRIAEASVIQQNGQPGEVLQADKNAWIIACKQDAISLLKVVPEGKKEMSGPDFLRGCPIQSGTVI